MPRIKIKGLPKMRKYALGGPNECPEGYKWNEFTQQCEPDLDYSPNEFQPTQQKMGSSTFPVAKQASGSGNIWANLGNNVSNMVNEDARQVNGLLNPAMFNPFDVKWGQEQVNPNINFTGPYSHDPLNRYATSSADSRSTTPTLSNTPMGGKGVLNTAALTAPQTSSSTTGKKKKSGNALSDIASSLGWGSVGLGVAGAMANRFDMMSRQKEYDKYARQSRLPDNYYAVNTAQDRGDYDVNDGMFRPNELGFKSKGMFANPYYAQRNFVRYGGMMKAAEGMSIPGTEIVQQAILPELPAINFAPSAPSGAAPVAPKAAPSYQAKDIKGSLKDVIAAKESGGNYKALPKKKDGTLASSAVGKYQFLWNQHKNWISEVTGINTKEGFMNNPEAQERAFDYWDKNILTPQAQKIKKELGVQVPLNNIKYSIHFAGPQGAYNYFKTGRETTDAFGSNIAKYANLKTSEHGGQNNSNMKIRIVGIPDETEMAYGGQPPYSGQSDYGLYVGQRNLYKTMAKHPYTDYKNTVSEEKPTKDNPHVLEAEDGETIYRPDGTHDKIIGDKHSEGGEKLTKKQAPEGSFIYSDTQKLKIKDPEVLKMFGKGGTKGITPATIAKQYQTNKYLSILQDPNTDKLSKETARKMIDNYERKLAELALVQESMKGFPQGIPDIAKGIMMAAQGPTMEEGMQEEQLTAKYGGSRLRKFVDAGPVDPVSLLWNPTGQTQQNLQVPGPYDPNRPASSIPDWYTPWLKSKTPKGSISPTGEPTTFDPSNPNKFYSDYNYWKNTIGRDFNSPEDLQGSIYDYIQGQDPNALDKMWGKWGPTAKGDKRKGFVDKYFGARTADVMGWRPGETPTPTPTPEKPKVTVKPGVTEEGTTPTKPGTPGVPGGDPTTSQNVPGGWTSQDIRNLGNAAMDYASLKKYHPYYTSVQPVLPEMVPVDWRGYAASLQSGANAAAQQLGAYTPGQSMAANLSQLAGQQAEGLGKYISDTDRANAGAAANTSAQRAGILNQFTQYNAALRDKAGEEENVYDDRYRAAERLARKGVAKAWDQGEDTASKIYNTNISESPYYTINPFTQRMQFNDEGARAAFENMRRNGYQEGSGAQNQAVSIYNSVYEQAKGTPEQRHDVAVAAMRELLGGGRQSSTEYPYAPTKNRTTKTTQTVKYGGSTKPGYSYYNPFLR